MTVANSAGPGYWHTTGFKHSYKYNSSVNHLMIFCRILALSYGYVSTFRELTASFFRVAESGSRGCWRGWEEECVSIILEGICAAIPIQAWRRVEAPRIFRQWSVVANVQVDKREWRTCLWTAHTPLLTPKRAVFGTRSHLLVASFISTSPMTLIGQISSKFFST